MPDPQTTRLAPCICGGTVDLTSMEGGRGTGRSTSYAIACRACGRREEDYPSNGSGRMRDALAEWNRERRRKAVAAT